MFAEVTRVAEVDEGAVRVPGMRALAVGCGGTARVEPRLSGLIPKHFQVGRPILGTGLDCISQSHCSKKGVWSALGSSHTFPVFSTFPSCSRYSSACCGGPQPEKVCCYLITVILLVTKCNVNILANRFAKGAKPHRLRTLSVARVLRAWPCVLFSRDLCSQGS